MVDVKKKKYPQWYKTMGLKHVTGFLTADEKQKMKKLAAAADKSLSRYVTRLMQQHIKDKEEEEMRTRMEERQRDGKTRNDGDGRVRSDGDGTRGDGSRRH